MSRARTPLAAWAKWFVSTDPARSIAPGFTINPADAEKLAKELAASAALPPPAATPRPGVCRLPALDRLY